MIREHSSWIWTRLTSASIWGPGRPANDSSDNIVQFDQIDLQAPLEEPADGMSVADEQDRARQQAGFSQHISC